MINVVNLHFIDKCNYKCFFCFVHKESKELNIEELKLIIDKISRYFIKNNINDGRINLAGGEPLISKHIQEIIDYIVSKNIKVSLITNGSLLNTKFIQANNDKLSMIGISVDSLNVKTNFKLGRFDRCTLSEETLVKLCNEIKQTKIKLKINTCVSKININEDLSNFIKKVKPDRFKILQVLPENDFSKDNSITSEEFENYLLKYKDIDYICETENDLLNSYLIVDSKGNLSSCNDHTSNKSLLGSLEIDDVLSETINTNKFENRYQKGGNYEH